MNAASDRITPAPCVEFLADAQDFAHLGLVPGQGDRHRQLPESRQAIALEGPGILDLVQPGIGREDRARALEDACPQRRRRRRGNVGVAVFGGGIHGGFQGA